VRHQAHKGIAGSPSFNPLTAFRRTTSADDATRGRVDSTPPGRRQAEADAVFAAPDSRFSPEPTAMGG
jgi:hypothetical protein